MTSVKVTFIYVQIESDLFGILTVNFFFIIKTEIWLVLIRMEDTCIQTFFKEIVANLKFHESFLWSSFEVELKQFSSYHTHATAASIHWA